VHLNLQLSQRTFELGPSDLPRTAFGFCIRHVGVALVAGFLSACAAAPAPAVTPEDTAQTAASILAKSSPASGATVTAPVNELRLQFNPPARLAEVTISGPDGTMPMMVHAVGETVDYSVPLPGLEAGNYVAHWRATAAGREYRGDVTFTVK
jgi:methionine-rich copper-binding protein CopC